jgi:hypothetical protein
VWLVSGVDEAHRFPRWTDAVRFYRQIVGDWLDADRDVDPELARSLDDLSVGQSHMLTSAGPCRMCP